MNLVKEYLINELFDKRIAVGQILLNIIKDSGHTKSSYSKFIDISRPTLDKLINGEIDNMTTFKSHINKILEKQNINESDLIEYTPLNQNSLTPTLVYSNNSPDNHEVTENAKKMFDLLDDVFNLCEIYYK